MMTKEIVTAQYWVYPEFEHQHKCHFLPRVSKITIHNHPTVETSSLITAHAAEEGVYTVRLA
jgi:hypothetical protein